MLHTIKEGYAGNQMNHGIFIEYTSKQKTFIDLIKWKLEKNNKVYTNHLEVLKDTKFLDQKEDYIVWLGHASFLIQIDGKRIITDPCLTAPPLTKRYTELPIHIADISPDYILISHGHYDHLDSKTLTFFDHATALIPLKMQKIIHKMNPSIKIQEAGWYQQYAIDEHFKIYFLPALHWHRRTAFDMNKVLWGSFIIQTPTKTIYFSGDTAYGEHFKSIGELFDIDIAILPIGAYEPRWFMKDNHMNTDDAKQAYIDLGAKIFLPMHFATFDLSNEALDEPEQIIRNLIEEEKLKILKIGEIWHL